LHVAETILARNSSHVDWSGDTGKQASWMIRIYQTTVWGVWSKPAENAVMRRLQWKLLSPPGQKRAAPSQQWQQ